MKAKLWFGARMVLAIVVLLGLVLGGVASAVIAGFGVIAATLPAMGKGGAMVAGGLASLATYYAMQVGREVAMSRLSKQLFEDGELPPELK